MTYFRYQNKNCFYEEHGQGRPLILLHGNTASSDMFADVIEAFSADYKVVLVDFLGHGRSDRVESFATDLWYDEAQQVIALIEQAGYSQVYLLGSSGGALVAINAALTRADLVAKVIADSFEGETPLKSFVENIEEDRKNAKADEGARAFYQAMHGDDWASVVDNDTQAIAKHYKTIGKLFHQPLEDLQADILLTGSRQDEFISLVDERFFDKTYDRMIAKIGHGQKHIFPTGGHPALLSNMDAFAKIAKQFLAEK